MLNQWSNLTMWACGQWCIYQKMGLHNTHACTLSTWSPLHFPYLLSSLSELCEGLPIVITQEVFWLKILSRLQHTTSTETSDWENSDIHRLQFVYFNHYLLILLLLAIGCQHEKGCSAERAVELCSSCVLMRWILMNPFSTCWSLIPIQKGLVFKFIIESRVISGLSHTVSHGIPLESLEYFLFVSQFLLYSWSYQGVLSSCCHLPLDICDTSTIKSW